MRAVILAAGRGSRLGDLTKDRPKCLVEIKSYPLVEWQRKALVSAGAKEIAVVTGYQASLLRFPWAYLIHNSNWAISNMVGSMLCASDYLTYQGGIVSYSDIIYSCEILKTLMKEESDIAITYDMQWRDLWRRRFNDPLDDAETFKYDKNTGNLLEIGRKTANIQEIQGQYMGLLKFSSQGWKTLKEFLASKKSEEIFTLDMTTLLNEMVKEGIKIKTVPIEGNWMEVDSPSDLKLCTQMLDRRELILDELGYANEIL